MPRLQSDVETAQNASICILNQNIRIMSTFRHQMSIEDKTLREKNMTFCILINILVRSLETSTAVFTMITIMIRPTATT